GLVALDHGRHLFTLVRMDQEHDLVVTHVVSSWISAAGGTPLAGTAPGRSWRTPWGKGLPADREPDIIAGGATAAQVVVLPGRGGAPHAAPWRAAGGQATLSASVVKLSPQPQAAAALGLLKVNCSFRPCFRKSIRVPSTRGRLSASTKIRTPSCSNTVSPGRWSRARSTA